MMLSTRASSTRPKVTKKSTLAVLAFWAASSYLPGAQGTLDLGREYDADDAGDEDGQAQHNRASTDRMMLPTR